MVSQLLRSSTALAVIISLSLPIAAPAQSKSGPTDLSQMAPEEITQAVQRCLRWLKNGRISPEGEILKGKGKGAKAKFCQAYVTGELDADLDPALASSALMAGAEQAEAAPAAGEQAEPAAPTEAEQAATPVDPAPEPATEAAPSQTAQTEAPAETSETAAEQNADETTAEAETPVESVANDGVNTAANAEAGAAAPEDTTEAETTSDTELAAALAEAEAGTDAAPASEPEPEPEVEPLDSQAQADALAEDEADDDSAAAAASADTTGEAEVVEETVTEDTARSSDEEFETAVNTPAAEAETTAEAETVAPTENSAAAAPAAEEDDGLSKLQKAALLGLGAVAIGQLLKQGETVVTNSGDRAVVEQNGQYRVIKNDDALLRQPGSNVTTYKFKDGSTRTVVVREDGAEVETIRARDGRVLRRTRTLTDGSSVVLFDDTQRADNVVVSELPTAAPRRSAFSSDTIDTDELALALAAKEAPAISRRFSLRQIRNIDAVRQLVPEITVQSINFETGSSVIRAAEAEELAALGNALREMIAQNPQEVFLIEGHTDAVGAAPFNLALSDRRAESVALALTEYFKVPPENMVVQGYGETDLAVVTQRAERANRRAAVRRITPLLQGGS
ncbi:OmpA family protein [Phaeobacter gallaeciensis]|uniref:Outer membrane protein n=1 Tax=Phaeobacter gallaeciensis TaxID=60890 RepID=A0AAC9ZAG1_9RHOB|nr:OmpA family protein [Phaeobacter gallaeciensis]AHD10140.1 Outer membrane protein [Phaeobacter gallaeciensis DSM 26640]ATE93404.1 putative outer membrane protein [Phaeobacter gallaeciensis]ATE96775.1 putative outer membrane protein [Phaeobacter gallaeciensis]ATF02068.1 putative outer membrane protein [Phaeobacter gallaeciensis]ATF06448.1 putative outer membrane protein [Phaeobacter gallaeciensis]